VNDPAIVRSLESFGDLLRDGQGLVQRNRTLNDPIGQRRPLDQLEDQRLRRLTSVGWPFFESVNTADVWMTERRENLRLAFKACAPLRI